MARRKNIRKAPTYHSRLFNDKGDAEQFVERMRLKMGSDFVYDVSFNEKYGLWHGRFWNKEDHDDYIH